MKSFKKSLNIILSVFLVFMFIVAVVDTQEVKHETNYSQENILHHIEKLTENGPRSIWNKEENQQALDYITDTLDSYGFVNEDTVDQPAYVLQDYVYTTEEYSNYYMQNLVVHIPANSDTPTGEAVMVMGHYDSVPMGDGASDDGLACGVMLEAINYTLAQMENGYTISNDLVFCFVNAEEFGLYGSDAFMREFVGFDNLLDRINFGINLESRGTSGTLIMFETAKNNYKTVQLLSEVNQNVFTCSIATMIYDMMPNGTDFSNFKEAYQGLNFANIGGGEDYHTQDDNLENLYTASYVSQQAQIVDGLLTKLANYDLSGLYDAEESAIFFSYLNITTVIYNHTAAAVFAIIALALLVINVFLGRKEGNLKNTVKAIITIVIGLALTAGITFLCYYIFQYIAVLTGHVDIHAVGTIRYSNTAIVVGISVLALAVSTFASFIGIKAFKLQARDLQRAFAYIHAVVGIVLTFALADASYMFIFTGILLLLNAILVNVKPQAEGLHLEILITALFFPLIMPLVVLATSALGLTMAYVFGLLFALAIFGVSINLVSICKYISVRRIFRKETSILEGILHIFVVSLLIFLVVSLCKPDVHMNLQGKQGISKYSYDDALVYVDREQEYRVYDLNAYPTLKKYCEDMEYNEEGYYVKKQELSIQETIQSQQASGWELNIQKADTDSMVYLTFSDIQADAFWIDDGKSVQSYDLTDKETYEITIHEDCKVYIEEGSALVEYKELIRDYETVIPEAYDEAEKLHFNLWMMEDFQLSCE